MAVPLRCRGRNIGALVLLDRTASAVEPKLGSSLSELLSGVLEPSAGSIELDGQDVTTLSVHQRVRRGLVRTFQISQLFDALTPLATLQPGLRSSGVWGGLTGTLVAFGLSEPSRPGGCR